MKMGTSIIICVTMISNQVKKNQMSIWEEYPENYREAEVQHIIRALQAGESALLIGLSGSGKSNLLNFLTNRWRSPNLNFHLIDCNTLEGTDPFSLFRALYNTIVPRPEKEIQLGDLRKAISQYLTKNPGTICFMLDRFESLQANEDHVIYNNMRSLRDSFKYQLTFLLATRYPLDFNNELAELFFANTIWLGTLSRSDSLWNIDHFTKRRNVHWDDQTKDLLIQISLGYPSLLRGVCEAYEDLNITDREKIIDHPAVRNRISEFWSSHPSQIAYEKSGLTHHPLLNRYRPHEFDTNSLTAKENVLLNYFLDHPNEVCEKDQLVNAVWSEEEIFAEGIRDDSLAQLIRRLRKKIEPDPSTPQYIRTVPGRGYQFNKDIDTSQH